MSADGFGLACECYLDGELVSGAVRDLSHTGFVVETSALFEVGLELELRLVGGAARRPVYLRAVVESRATQGALAADNHVSVRFRLLGFSEEFGLLIAGISPGYRAGKTSEQRHRPTRRESEREWLASIIDTEQPETQKNASEPRSATQPDWEDWEEYEPLLERAGEPLWSEDSLAPEAIIIDDGELDDVVRVLAELGVKAERQSPDRDSILTNWVPPQQLLVATAQRALKLRLPLHSAGQSFVSVAVADGDARAVCSAVRRLGYHYAISRPIHPLAMTMLFRQAIFPDDDRRGVPREILGCSVRWWSGWKRKRPAVILDISQNGCQLLVRGSAELRSRVKIRVPTGMAGDGGFTLVGHVIRVSRGRGATALGVTFDALSARAQSKLQRVLALPGPCRLTGESLVDDGGGRRFSDSWRPSDLQNAKADGPRRDRRLKVRAALQQEIVALEHGSGRVKHLLVSHDLTADGMRVDAHPSLVLGEPLDLALYEDPEGDPLVLSAVVARDDGRSGWWLRFVGVTAEAEGRLARALERFPPLSRLDREDPESGRVVLGRILVEPEAPKEDPIE